jgi:hypothetical protein
MGVQPTTHLDRPLLSQDENLKDIYILKFKRYLNIRLFLRPVVDPINNWDFFA